MLVSPAMINDEMMTDCCEDVENRPTDGDPRIMGAAQMDTTTTIACCRPKMGASQSGQSPSTSKNHALFGKKAASVGGGPQVSSMTTRTTKRASKGESNRGQQQEERRERLSGMERAREQKLSP